MKQIPLTQGKFALVDDEDYAFLSQWKWRASHTRRDKTWYAIRSVGSNPRRAIGIHTLLMSPPEGKTVDHKDRDGLNNQKGNLRVCMPFQNNINKGPSAGKKFKGTYAQNGKFAAKIRHNETQYYLGIYEIEADAARAYDEAARKHHGEFAYLNFPIAAVRPATSTAHGPEIKRVATTLPRHGYDSSGRALGQVLSVNQLARFVTRRSEDSKCEKRFLVR